MAVIAHLPVEIIQAIADQVESSSRGKDLKNFRAICKYVDTILAPRVLSTAVCDLSDWRNTRGLIRMAARQNRVHQFARTLKIEHLAPGADANRLAPHITIQKDGSYKYIKQLPKEDTLQAVQIISQYLPGALQHFHFLEVVHWKTHVFDIGNSNRTLIDLLCSQEKLRSVLIDMSRDVSFPYPQLGQLSNLKELSITFPRIHIRAGPLYSGTAQAICNSPDLLNLQLKLQPDYIHPDLVEFDEIYRQMASLRKIEKLSLGIRTTLDLTKFPVFDNMVRLTSLDIRPEMLASTLWTTLKHLQIHLRTISFNILNMEHAFLDYLSSYSGVRELLLSNTEDYWVDGTRDYTDIATRFFDVIVYRHAATLEALEVFRHSDAVWGNVPDRPGCLAKLRALRRLKIELPNNEIVDIQGSGTDDDRRLCMLLEIESRVW